MALQRRLPVSNTGAVLRGGPLFTPLPCLRDTLTSNVCSLLLLILLMSGCKHIERPFFSVQFHPEAHGGPQDTSFLFDQFLDHVRVTKARSPQMSMALGPALAAGKSLDSAIQSHDRMRFPAAPIIASYPPLKKVRAAEGLFHDLPLSQTRGQPLLLPVVPLFSLG